jgi:hypothetical protein
MTGQPPEGSERIYTGQYGGDPFMEYDRGSQGSYGEPRYRENPADYTLPGGPVSYDSTPYEFPPVASEPPPGFEPQGAGPQPGFQPGIGPQTGPQRFGPQHTGPNKFSRPARPPRQRPGGGAMTALRSALSDVEFTSLATPTIVPVLYKVAIAVSALVALGLAVVGFEVSLIFGVVALIILAPAVFVLGVGLSRLFMEFCLIAFRMAGEPKGGPQNPANPDMDRYGA